MEKFAQEVANSYWWLSVVATSLLLNLVAAYVKTPLDRALARISKSARARLREQRIKIERDIQELSTDPSASLDYVGAELGRRVRAVVWALGAIFSFLFYLNFKLNALMAADHLEDIWLRYAFAAGSLMFLLFAFMDYLEASRRRSVLMMFRQSHHQTVTCPIAKQMNLSE